MQETKSFRLSIWKPAELLRPVCYSNNDNTGHHGVVFDQQRLHEQVYQWDPGGIDIWACVENTEEMSTIKDMMSEFSPSLPPLERSMHKLSKFILLLKEAKINNASTWSDITEVIEIDEEEINLRSDPFLCLINQLDWVYRIFSDIPNSSVVIR